MNRSLSIKYFSIAAIALALGFVGTATAAEQPAPAPQERVAAVKSSFAESQKLLREYEWIETTVTSIKNEEKARTQNRCYYGAEGKLQKVPVAAPPAEKPAKGILGKIKEKKKEELADYMEKAAGLVHMYVPPDPQRIENVKQAGKATIHVLDPNKRARLEFRDYLLEGDTFSVEIDLVSNKILALSVATWLDTPKDAVHLNVKFDTFPDGTIYTAHTTLDVKAKNVNVTVVNSGYRKAGK